MLRLILLLLGALRRRPTPFAERLLLGGAITTTKRD